MYLKTKPIKIASLNVNGVIDRNRFRQVLTQMHTDEVSVLTLQETHVDDNLAERFRDDFPRVDILSALDPQGRAGVMIIIDKEQARFDGDLRALDWGLATGRILMSGIKTAREFFTVGCVYMPPAARERISFGRTLTEIARRCLNGRARCDFACGDWNMVYYREDSKAGHRSGDEDQEVHAMVLNELMGEETDYLDGWRQR